jgi:hypothetical protein
MAALLAGCGPMDPQGLLDESRPVEVNTNAGRVRFVRVRLGNSQCEFFGAPGEFFDLCRLTSPPRETTLKVRLEMVTAFDQSFDIEREIWLPQGGEIDRLNVFPPFEAMNPRIEVGRRVDTPSGAALERRWIPTPSGAPSYEFVNREPGEVELFSLLQEGNNEASVCGRSKLGPGESALVGCPAGKRPEALFEFSTVVTQEQPLAPDVALETSYHLSDSYYAE